MSATWNDVGAIKDVAKQGARVVRSSIGRVADIRCLNGDVFGIEDTCAHVEGPLGQGIVGDRRATCPLHDLDVDLATGDVVGPEEEGCVVRFPLSLESGRVLQSGRVLLGLGALAARAE